MGSKKSKQTSTTKVELDPQTQELNAMRLAQERIMAPYRERGAQLVGNVFDPSFSLPTGVSGAGYRDLQGNALPGMNMSDMYNNMPGLSDMKFSSGQEALAASRLAALTDVSGLQRSANTHISKVVAPELMAQAIASGMGRGGAGLEALAKASGQFTIPIEQARMGAEQNFANWLTGRADLRTNLATGVSDPARMSFTGAPTTTQTQTSNQGGNIWGSILGLVGTGVGAYFGGPWGAAAGNAIGSSLGGGGSPAWDTSRMSSAYSFGG